MITVIMPVYNEGPYIYENVRKTDAILQDANIDHRFLLVDDGSKDKTWEELCRLHDDFPYVETIRLSRNFGKEAALCAALENATGDAVVVMDADLQHPPKYIPEMVAKWQEGYDVVECVKTARQKESLFNRLFAKLFYKTFKASTGLEIDAASDFKLIDRAALEAWKKLPEHNTFFRGLSVWVGFKRYQMPFEVAEREGGETKWTFRKLVKLAVDSITAYTTAPLLAILWIGVLMFGVAIVLAAITLVRYFIPDSSASGIPTVILLLLFIGSCLMISLSILGLYVARIYDEVKGRPRYLIMDYRKEDSNETP